MRSQWISCKWGFLGPEDLVACSKKKWIVHIDWADSRCENCKLWKRAKGWTKKDEEESNLDYGKEEE